MGAIKDKFLRAKRYFLFGMQWLLMEKVRGLDFTMRDMELYRKTDGRYHGYSKTNEKHLKEIFRKLSYENAKFLDVGCGKGVVLKEAVKFPFQKIAGIEISPELVGIARRNFEILKIEDKVKCMQADAAEFEQYADYNVFFFFNPFAEEIMQKVVDKIMKGRREDDRDITVIYHNPRFLSVFENKAERDEIRIVRKEMLHEPLKDYDTCILWIDCITDVFHNS